MKLSRDLSLRNLAVGVLAAAVVLGALVPSRTAPQAAELVSLPPHLAETPLAQALTTYRALSESGGWSSIQSGSSLRLGDAGEGVAALRLRLAREGYLPPSTSEGRAAFFDPALEAAVREFQRRHGMEEDGVVGPLTLAALTWTAALVGLRGLASLFLCAPLSYHPAVRFSSATRRSPLEKAYGSMEP